MLTALRLYLREATGELAAAARSVASALDELGAREAATALPGYTHMQQAMPSSVALWAGGFAAEIRDDADNLEGVYCGAWVVIRWAPRPAMARRVCHSTGMRPPASWGFDSTQTPVTAAQLSRGKAEAHLLFEITLLMQDLGRFAADVLLFYTQEFSFLTLSDAFTTGSSIMPQKRNPDVFELLRGRSATAHAALDEALGIFAKLPSGYQRDLQLLKAPLFRGIDLAAQTLDLLPAAIAAMSFRSQNIKLDPSIHAAEQPMPW